MSKLSDTALAVLSNAAQHPDRLVDLPARLPAAARNVLARSMAKQGLLEAAVGDVLSITDAGFRALNLEPPEDIAIATEPRSGQQGKLDPPIADAVSDPAPPATPRRAY